MKNVNGDSTASREKTIVRTSVIGIIANVFLAAFKAVIGLMSSSIAIIMDAVNNISDAGSRDTDSHRCVLRKYKRR
ncbi:MAG: hypothetical protein J5783_06405 [Lachnospiraceae bacterium]|nr:hypothetical protein [Lachnospiraceae bacterium]